MRTERATVAATIVGLFAAQAGVSDAVPNVEQVEHCHAMPRFGGWGACSCDWSYSRTPIWTVSVYRQFNVAFTVCSLEAVHGNHWLQSSSSMLKQ